MQLPTYSDEPFRMSSHTPTLLALQCEVQKVPSYFTLPPALILIDLSRSSKMKLIATPIAAIGAMTLIMNGASAGPAAYGVCQAGCAAVVTACYAAAGFTWGATLGATAPASIVACNSAFGTCQAACAAVGLAPTP